MSLLKPTKLELEMHTNDELWNKYMTLHLAASVYHRLWKARTYAGNLNRKFKECDFADMEGTCILRKGHKGDHEIETHMAHKKALDNVRQADEAWEKHIKNKYGRRTV